MNAENILCGAYNRCTQRADFLSEPALDIFDTIDKTLNEIFAEAFKDS